MAGASMAEFGDYIRKQREKRKQADSSFSVRQVASRIGVEPSFLSKVERNIEPPPSEEKIIAIADDLDEDADVLLAMAGKVSSDLKLIICKRPALFEKMFWMKWTIQIQSNLYQSNSDCKVFARLLNCPQFWSCLVIIILANIF